MLLCLVLEIRYVLFTTLSTKETAFSALEINSLFFKITGESANWDLDIPCAVHVGVLKLVKL